MNIQIELSRSSIELAKRKLLEIKEKFQNGEIMKDFLDECSKYLLERAKFHLEHSGIGANVINEINSCWKVTKQENRIIFTNDAPKAVFVEFGVGIVGEQDSHPNSMEEGYEYNVPTIHKYLDGSWEFLIDDLDDLDLPLDNIELQDNVNENHIVTQGAKGVWFAYNALQDLDQEKVNIWKRIKERHIG